MSFQICQVEDGETKKNDYEHIVKRMSRGVDYIIASIHKHLTDEPGQADGRDFLFVNVPGGWSRRNEGKAWHGHAIYYMVNRDKSTKCTKYTFQIINTGYGVNQWHPCKIEGGFAKFKNLVWTGLDLKDITNPDLWLDLLLLTDPLILKDSNLTSENCLDHVYRSAILHLPENRLCAGGRKRARPGEETSPSDNVNPRGGNGGGGNGGGGFWYRAQTFGNCVWRGLQMVLRTMANSEEEYKMFMLDLKMALLEFLSFEVFGILDQGFRPKTIEEKQLKTEDHRHHRGEAVEGLTRAALSQPRKAVSNFTKLHEDMDTTRFVLDLVEHGCKTTAKKLVKLYQTQGDHTQLSDTTVKSDTLESKYEAQLISIHDHIVAKKSILPKLIGLFDKQKQHNFLGLDTDETTGKRLVNDPFSPEHLVVVGDQDLESSSVLDQKAESQEERETREDRKKQLQEKQVREIQEKQLQDALKFAEMKKTNFPTFEFPTKHELDLYPSSSLSTLSPPLTLPEVKAWPRVHHSLKKPEATKYTLPNATLCSGKM